MTGETQRYLELLERRTALLGALAEALTAARGDLVALDVDGLEARIARQEAICREVCALDAELDRVQEQCAMHMRATGTGRNGMSSDTATLRLREARERLQTAQARVKQLNDAHQVLLRRCRRTAGALLNSYATFAATYADPFASGVNGVPAAGFSREGGL